MPLYCTGIRDVDHLKQRLVEEWRQLSQDIIEQPVRQWRVLLSVKTAAILVHFSTFSAADENLTLGLVYATVSASNGRSRVGNIRFNNLYISKW